MHRVRVGRLAAFSSNYAGVQTVLICMHCEDKNWLFKCVWIVLGLEIVCFLKQLDHYSYLTHLWSIHLLLTMRKGEGWFEIFEGDCHTKHCVWESIFPPSHNTTHALVLLSYDFPCDSRASPEVQISVVPIPSNQAECLTEFFSWDRSLQVRSSQNLPSFCTDKSLCLLSQNIAAPPVNQKHLLRFFVY